MSEPSGRVRVEWPAADTGGRNVEPQEKDPEIDTLYYVGMKVGDRHTFNVGYKTFRGPATITLYDAKQKIYTKTGRSRNGTLQFTIAKATKAHHGTYTVEVKDEQRREVESLNPVRSSCQVDVDDSWCAIL
ncbi:uncharacterized protein [Asterias amurensis]|uniref:uncharacterized protein n=1 Tax=Asterias amurensis TaxID=7602 RepID=UPI003AB72319